MSCSRILIVDDEAGIRDQLARWLNSEGYTVEHAENGAEALSSVKKSNFNLVLLDLKLPDLDGFEVLEKIHKGYPDICIIVLTGYGRDESPAQARRLGAFDFFEKPIQFDALSQRIDDAISQFWAQKQNEYQSEEKQRQFQFENIIGESQPMRELFDIIKRVADTDETVLLLGESGAGKDLVAGAIHYNSRRRKYPLITANCTTLHENLAESELFGHEKGAFTGATERKIGKMQQAHLTSLFINEIGELSPLLQAKFLQFLQYKTFERLGGNEQIAVDARIITATNMNVEKAVAEKRFRKDLFFRLNRFAIRVPPLRERRSDIPLLITHFIKACNRRNGKNIKGISPAALRLFDNYSFPGNVRELENIIAQAMLLENSNALQTETICSCLIQPVSDAQPNYRDMTFRDARNIFEKAYFSQILDKAGGIITKAAKLAGLDRGYFRNKLKEHGLWERY
ncbi:MAG: sigma-54-dependent transcriptional regulator [bacterium]